MPATPLKLTYWNRGELDTAIGGKSGTTKLTYWTRGELYPGLVAESAVTGTGGIVLDDLVFGGAATVSGPAAGSGAFTLDDLVFAGVAAEIFSAAGAFTLDDLVFAGAAQSFTETGAFTLGALVFGGAGAITFSHVGPLAISSVSPNVAGDPTLVVIRGTGFLGTTKVMFGSYNSYGYPSTLPVVINDTEIHVYAESPWYLSSGNHDTTVVDVQVFTLDDPGGSPIVPADKFTLLAPPVLTAITPSIGDIHSNTPVTITGKNLTGTFLIELGPYAAAFSFTVVSDTTLTATIATSDFGTLVTPPSTTFAVRVWNRAGPSAYLNPDFTIYTTPIIVLPKPDGAGDALSGRYGPVAMRYRFEQRDRRFTFLADITTAVREDTGCTVHLDNTQPVARTADFIFDATVLPAGFDASEPSRYGVAVWADIDVNGTTEPFCLGLFHLDTPVHTQYAGGYDELSAKGADMTVVLSDRTTTAAYTVPSGTNYMAAVAAICARFGLVTALPVETSVTPEAFVWPAQTTYLQIANDLLYGINYYPVWATPTGQITTRERIAPATESPAVVYDTTQEPKIVTSVNPAQRSLNVSQLWNWITVAIDDPLRTPALVVHSNDDPANPASIAQSGKSNFKAITGTGSPSSKCVRDSTALGDICTFEILDQAVMAVQRQITTAPDPRRTNREWYFLTLDTFEVATLWRVAGWDYPCVPGGPMVHTLEYAQAITVSGAPPLTEVLQLLGAKGNGSTSPLAGADLTLTLASPMSPSSAIVTAVLADTDPTGWTLTDTGSRTHTLLSYTASFGISGSHPVLDGGLCYLGLFVSRYGAALPVGAVLTFAPGGDAYYVAMASYEITGLSTFGSDPDGADATAVASDGGGADSITTLDSGLTGASSTATDLVVGIAGAVYDGTAFDGGPAPARTFAVNTGDGWDSTWTEQVVTFPHNDVYPVLYCYLQVVASTGTHRIRGTLSHAAAGTGALAAQLIGTHA